MTVEEWKRKNPPIRRKPLTNADRIRQMTDEELAEYIIVMTDDYCGGPDKCKGRSCYICRLEWMGKEVEG